MKLENKVALISGGGTGIGFASAKKMVEEGAYVYITGRRENKLKEAAEKIGHNVGYLPADVTKKETLEALVQKIKKEQGHIDIVFANAGIGHNIPLTEIDKKEFDRTMDTNVLGTYYLAQTALPIMPDGSTIILNTSATDDLGLKNFSLYIAAKNAERSFAHTWTNELRDRKIRVNAIAPGVIPTDAATGELGRTPEEEKESEERRGKLIPAGTVGNVDDIANAVVFLASDDARYINGVELRVDGGLASVYPVKL